MGNDRNKRYSNLKELEGKVNQIFDDFQEDPVTGAEFRTILTPMALRDEIPKGRPGRWTIAISLVTLVIVFSTMRPNPPHLFVEVWIGSCILLTIFGTFYAGWQAFHRLPREAAATILESRSLDSAPPPLRDPRGAADTSKSARRPRRPQHLWQRRPGNPAR